MKRSIVEVLKNIFYIKDDEFLEEKIKKETSNFVHNNLISKYSGYFFRFKISNESKKKWKQNDHFVKKFPSEIEYAKKLLETTFGPERAIDIIDRLVSNLQVKPFDFLRKVDVAQLVNVLQNEHPQTVALILCYLPPQVAAKVIAELPEYLQVDVIKRISTMDSSNPDIVKEIENKLKDRLSAFTVQSFSQVGGIDISAEIMNNIDRAMSNKIFEKLSERDPRLSDEIRRRMFVFEDITKLDDRSIQRVLREVDSKDLTLALKGASEEVKDIIFRNMSKRAAQIVQEELDYMGPVRVRDVDEAQQRIVNIIRKLEESGEIIIRGGAGEELIE